MVNSVSISIQYLVLVINLLFLFTSGVPWKSITKNVPRKFLDSPPNCNPHNYSLILNSPNICSDDEVFLLILVRSVHGNVLRRKSIRRTWGSLKEVRNDTVRVAFLFGNNTEDLNGLLKEEHGKYQDIVQESFPEMYTNLDRKTVMAWKWQLTYCPDSTFVMVCNDEEFVDIFKTVTYLQEIIEMENYEDFIACWVTQEGTGANRHLTHKHGVSWKDYPGKHYPAFCNGNGYVASQQIIRKLYKMSLDTPTFMPDDVWIGVLSAKLGLVISNVHDKISIDVNKRTIQQYHTFDKYVNLNTILFPLDRIDTKCEVCVINYLWPRILRYNSPPENVKAPPKRVIHCIYLLLFLACFAINVVVLSHHYIWSKRNVVLFSVIGVMFLFVVLFPVSK